MGGVEEVPHPDDPAVRKLIEQGHMHLNRRAARLSGRALMKHGQDAIIARVDQALQLDGPVEILDPSAHELDETLAPSVDGPKADGGARIWISKPFGIGNNDSGLENPALTPPSQTSLELVDSPAKNLHVPLGY